MGLWWVVARQTNTKQTKKKQKESKMGNIITIGGGEKHDPVDLFLDFEKAQPQTDEERAIYDAIAQVLGEFSFFLFHSLL